MRIPERFKTASFETAKGDLHELPDSCLLIGPVGCGKTHLVWCKIKELCKKFTITNSYDRCWTSGEGFTEKNLLFTTTPVLLSEIKACFDNPNKSGQDIIKAHCTCDYLILDDLGAEKITDYTREVLYQIIDYRYSNCKPLIITSNLDLNKIAECFDDRIASRISATCKIITLEKTDYRMDGIQEQ
jgi:DNA replication protein DnaC